MSRAGGRDVAVAMRDCGISTTSQTRPVCKHCFSALPIDKTSSVEAQIGLLWHGFCSSNKSDRPLGAGFRSEKPALEVLQESRSGFAPPLSGIHRSESSPLGSFAIELRGLPQSENAYGESERLGLVWPMTWTRPAARTSELGGAPGFHSCCGQHKLNRIKLRELLPSIDEYNEWSFCAVVTFSSHTSWNFMVWSDRAAGGERRGWWWPTRSNMVF